MAASIIRSALLAGTPVITSRIEKTRDVTGKISEYLDLKMLPNLWTASRTMHEHVLTVMPHHPSFKDFLERACAKRTIPPIFQIVIADGLRCKTSITLEAFCLALENGHEP